MSRVTRRSFIRGTITAALLPAAGCASRPQNSTQRVTSPHDGVWVNDVHSQINPTRVAAIESPRNLDELATLLDRTRNAGQSLSLCGGRHAGGGQQFLSRKVLLDMSGLREINAFDRDRGLLDIGAGARWPHVYAYLQVAQSDGQSDWGIRQKQGGADQLSLGAAVAANVHGRCLSSAPIVTDIESINVLTTAGQLVLARSDDPNTSDLFRHVVGGYGMFGIVTSITLRLARRRRLARRVRWVDATEAIPLLEARRDAGALHGDFQYCVDERRDDFCAAGLCSWYEPTDEPVSPVRLSTPERETELNRFRALIELAHKDKSRAFELYKQDLLAADGQVDYADDWQHGDYAPGYHHRVDANSRGNVGSEILTELYVPRPALMPFLRDSAHIIRRRATNLIYGTVRLIEPDRITRLAWAKQAYACVIFNFHTALTAPDIERCAETFRDLLDVAISFGGSYYLTYHRFARLDQTIACYPELPDVLEAKSRFDPTCTLLSDWHRHYQTLIRPR